MFLKLFLDLLRRIQLFLHANLPSLETVQLILDLLLALSCGLDTVPLALSSSPSPENKDG